MFDYLSLFQLKFLTPFEIYQTQSEEEKFIIIVLSYSLLHYSLLINRNMVIFET